MHRSSEPQQHDIEEIKAAISHLRGAGRKAYLPVALQQRIARLVDDGLPLSTAARMLGVSKSAIYRWRRRQGSGATSALPAPMPPHVLAINDAVATPAGAGEACRPHAPPTLRVQLGGFDLRIAWQSEASTCCR